MHLSGKNLFHPLQKRPQEKKRNKIPPPQGSATKLLDRYSPQTAIIKQTQIARDCSCQKWYVHLHNLFMQSV